MLMGSFPFKEMEQKWQKKWEETGLYKTDITKNDKKLYSLVMFSYPSGANLHCGHWYNYGPSDTWTRMKKMQGFNIFEPMGFDAFGMPAENYAIKTGIHPKDHTKNTIKIMEEQLKAIGAMYDWDYEVVTCDPEYYKWTQWLFLQLYKKGLAYRANAPVNWCPSCQTVLANEQVVDSACERCGTEVKKKNLTQWFFKITDYADKLLTNLDGLDWPERTKHMQRNWIGRSEGAEIQFKIDGSDKTLTVFTTRPDTLFGVTYVVMAPEHPWLDELTTTEQKKSVDDYRNWAVHQEEVDRLSTSKEKTGVFTGRYAVNPVNGRKVPIWVSDYVLYNYGTGVVMAVPAHDERDFEFAQKFELPIERVIAEKKENAALPLDAAYTEDGFMVNSGEYNGMGSEAFKSAIVAVAEKNNFGSKKINFRLRDWLLSRQRYWGAPIPIIHCEHCGEVPVPEKDLPVELPYDVNFEPTGESPLVKHPTFKNTVCPKCGKPAVREADTMDTFVDSSWYYLRYPDSKNTSTAFDTAKINKWLPVDMYVGGAEHACMHLIYARFITMALKDMGYINFEEPFTRLRHQGTILGEDGFKMSKSRGNTVMPDKYISQFGTDVFRMFLMFTYDYAIGGAWNDANIKAIDRYLDRVWRLITEEEWTGGIFGRSGKGAESSASANDELTRMVHVTIKGVTEDTEAFRFNTAISKLMELTNALFKYVQEVPRDAWNIDLLKETIATLIQLIAPYAPHTAEELWERIGKPYSVFNQPWPKHDDAKLIAKMIAMAVQVNGKVRAEIEVPAEADEAAIKEFALNHEKVIKNLEGKEIVKVIVVKGRIINIVVK